MNHMMNKRPMRYARKLLALALLMTPLLFPCFGLKASTVEEKNQIEFAIEKGVLSPLSESSEKSFTNVRGGGLTVQNVKTLFLAGDIPINVNITNDPDRCMGVTEGKGGAFSGKLFLVSINRGCLPDMDVRTGKVLKASGKQDFKLRFVIKEHPAHITISDILSEIMNLEVVRDNAGKIMNLKDPRFPVLTYDESNFIYYDVLNRPSFFTVLHAARGSSFNDRIRNKAIPAEDKLRSFARFGRSLGAFHVRNMDQSTLYSQSDGSKGYFELYMSVVHGDLHWNNLLETDRKFYFIDNASIADSLGRGIDSLSKVPNSSKRPILMDFMAFFSMPTFGWKILRQVDNSMLLEGYKQFFENYIAQYPASERSSVSDYFVLVIEGGLFMNTYARKDAPDNADYDQMLKAFHTAIATHLKGVDWDQYGGTDQATVHKVLSKFAQPKKPLTRREKVKAKFQDFKQKRREGFYRFKTKAQERLNKFKARLPKLKRRGSQAVETGPN